jgi:hypothetical protein
MCGSRKSFRVGLGDTQWEDHVAKKSKPNPGATAAKPELDAAAMTATTAGFLAAHVLTLRFLVDEGIVNRERLIAFLDSAMEGMRPGLADPRSLFVLNQMLNSLRQPASEAGMQ